MSRIFRLTEKSLDKEETRKENRSAISSLKVRFSCVFVVLILLTSSQVVFLLSGETCSLASSFTDLGNTPSEVVEAIDYVTAKGYMMGRDNGQFEPNIPASRIELARALVGYFKLPLKDLPEVRFTDLTPNDKRYPYAAACVAGGLMERFADGSFKPGKYLKTWEVFKSLIIGLGFELECTHLQGLNPRAPYYACYLVIACDLKMKRRNSRVRPEDEYPRGELAYTLKAADFIDSWRLEYVRSSFDWMNCQQPLVGAEREAALDAAFSKMGYPYVWGGESDSEGGYDCSGLVYFVFHEKLGYPMFRVADDQARDSNYPRVERSQLLAGDPVFFFGRSSSGGNGYVDHAGIYIGHDLFIHSTGSNSGVSIDRLSGYWDDNFAWGKRVIKECEPLGFDAFILLTNPGKEESQAKLDFMLSSGQRFERVVKLKPRSRKTLRLDDIFYNQEISTLVTALRGEVVAERSMYFNYGGNHPGGHCGASVNCPSAEWYLAEGCTAYNFDTYILIMNPSPKSATVKCDYLLSSGRKIEQIVEVSPESRLTIHVDSVKGMGSVEFSARIISSVPIIVERSMYFDYAGVRDGHNSPGVVAPSKKWYFAEGYTAYSFDTYILLMNPNNFSVPAEIRFIATDGKSQKVKIGMPPLSRRTIAVDRIKGFESREFSTEVTCAVAPIIAERSMYFKYGEICGGHCVLGLARLSRQWFFAEGYTDQSFDTYFLIVNPGKKSARVVAEFMLATGKNIKREFRIAANSRFTICADSVKGLEKAEFSLRIETDRELIAERSMYFKYGGITGGSSAPGISQICPYWYFAEGYTGM